jgi:hypothetical protein
MTEGTLAIIEPIAHDFRLARARQFAAQIIAVIGDCIEDKRGAESRLIDAAYQADAVIRPFGEVGETK